jgi:uncharacterized protein involved in exopolysaccharide biosynthesis
MPIEIANEVAEDSINLLGYWRTLVKYLKLIGSIVGSVVLLTGLIMIFLPNVYEGKTVLIPQGKTEGSLGAALGTITNLLPVGFARPETPAVRLLGPST